MMTHAERERKFKEHKEAAERRVRRITADADKARLLLVPPEKPVVYSEPVGYIPEPGSVEAAQVEPEPVVWGRCLSDEEIKKESGKVYQEEVTEAEVTQYVPASVTPKKSTKPKVATKPKKSTKVKVG